MLQRVTRSPSSSLLMVSLAGLVLSAISARCQTKQAAPDVVLVHGRILTVDAHDSIAEAIAIRDGRILRVGTSADILAMATERTRVIDLHGKAATPGLIDAHGHFADGGVFASNADKNPTLTIMALAWRVADHVLERMRRKEL